MEKIAKILAVTRSTKGCKNVIQTGAALARRFDAVLYVVDVVTDPFSIKGWNLPIASLEKEHQKLLQQAKEELREVIDSERIEGLAIKDSVVEGDPVQSVLGIVKEEGIDLLILLAHEEWGPEHFFFGRSNDALIRAMPCAILLLKAQPEV